MVEDNSVSADAITAEEAPQEETTAQSENSPGVYEYPYFEMVDGLYYRKETKKGEDIYRISEAKPRILSEITFDNGTDTVRKKYRIAGTMANGMELKTVDVLASELDSLTWMKNNWPATCDVEVFPQASQHFCHALRSTAKHATHTTVFSCTGWKKMYGEYTFLLPGNGRYEVELTGKQRMYSMENTCSPDDLSVLYGLTVLDFIPHEVMLPCLALVFLSPLNHFLKAAGAEPKFILTLIGHSGSMKSTVAALMLSFYGRFSATDLPMSFSDTANSIIYNAFALKDVLTVIDDFRPASRLDGETMKGKMQTLARGYGDRAGRNRLNTNITLQDERVPQGNAIVTAEFLPDIGESGIARLFCIDMKPKQIDLPRLTDVQGMAAEGILRRCMYGYLTWLRDTYFFDEESEAKFIESLGMSVRGHRDEWRRRLQEAKIKFHDRLPDTLASLELGLGMMLRFLLSQNMYGERTREAIAKKEEFLSVLMALAAKQAVDVIHDTPTHIFIRKLFAMLDCGQAVLLDSGIRTEILPNNFIGYQDEKNFYITFDPAHRLVRKFCNDQGENFAISSASLSKALWEEGFIKSASGEKTSTKRFANGLKRVMTLPIEKLREVSDAE